jgi:hypothetical protein
MAEAEGSPKKTTTYKDFGGMNTQDSRYGVEPNEMAYLENIMSIAEGKLHSVPGPGPIVDTFGNGGFLLLQSRGYVLLQSGGRIKLRG